MLTVDPVDQHKSTGPRTWLLIYRVLEIEPNKINLHLIKITKYFKCLKITPHSTLRYAKLHRISSPVSLISRPYLGWALMGLFQPS